MSTLTGCRACSHYSVGRMSPVGIRTSNDPFGHKCNFDGKARPRLIRWPVEGRAEPVDIPAWCPMEAVGERLAEAERLMREMRGEGTG